MEDSVKIVLYLERKNPPKKSKQASFILECFCDLQLNSVLLELLIKEDVIFSDWLRSKIFHYSTHSKGIETLLLH